MSRVLNRRSYKFLEAIKFNSFYNLIYSKQRDWSLLRPRRRLNFNKYQNYYREKSCIIIRSPNKIRLKNFSGKQKTKLVPFHLWTKQVIINNPIRNCKTVIFTIWALLNLIVNPFWPRAINFCIFSIWMKRNATHMTFWFIAIQRMMFTHSINDNLKWEHI